MARLQRKGTLTLWLGRRKSIHHPWTRCRSTFLPSFFTPPSLLFLSWLIISHPPTTFIFFFFFKWAMLLFIFGCAGSSLPHKLFSSCSAWGLLSSCSACFSLQWLLLLQSTGSRATGSVLVGLRLSCFEACGIFLDQGLNLCLLN